MAELLTSPANDCIVGDTVQVTGTDWGTDPVVVTSHNFDVTLVPETNEISGFAFRPTRPGVIELDADDGTDQASVSIRVHQS
jgi:hypothetical protein